MGKLFAVEYVTLDGVFEEPAWSGPYFNDELSSWQNDNLIESDALLLGRRTYEGFSAAWPERDGAFADKFNAMPKYVVSSTLTDPAWNNTHVERGVDDVAKLVDGAGGPLLVAGSGTLVHGLYDAGLVDEWRLMVFPVVLGSGRRLFPSDALDKTKLQLVDTTTYANGVQLQIFRSAR